MSLIEKNMPYVREQFKIYGMEALTDLAKTPEYRVQCVRIFLKHWNHWLQKVDVWAEKVANNCDLLLPVSIAKCQEPELFQDIQEFEIEYFNKIQSEIDSHPKYFSAPTISTVRINLSIDEWKTDRKNKEALNVENDDELQLVKEKLLEILKGAFQKQGKNTSNYSECELVHIARRGLPQNPQLYEHLIFCVMNKRRSVRMCNEFIQGLGGHHGRQ